MLRIAIADDHTLMRESFALLIGTFGGMQVIVQAHNGSVLLEKLRETSVDLILLDLEMPVMNGYETCLHLREQYPDTKVIVVSHLATKESLHKALEAGVHGYFIKTSSPDQLENAIHSVTEKGIYIDPDFGTILHQMIFSEKSAAKKDPLSVLTSRELEIIEMVAKGLDNHVIADKLCINKRTVESHRQRILDKVDVKNFTGVILLALKHKYLSLRDL
jgi:DNA-binding NarL/FixJ family response regulator